MIYSYSRMDYILLPNGIKKEYTFDDDGIMTGMKYTKDDGAVTLYQFDYIYGSNSNVIKQTITNPSDIQTIYNYSYDPIDRLVNVSKNNSENTWYDFDPMGNRLKKRMSGTIEKMENYDYNACDELRCMDGTIFEYDMNGNMTKKIVPSEGSTQYTYNYNNRLFRIDYPDNTNSQYFYNSAGLRIKKTDKTGKTTYYYWDGTDRDEIPNAINETDKDSNITNTYWSETGFKSIYNNGEWRYFIKDHFGSVIALTDNNGNVTDCYEYDEYGNLSYSSGVSYNPYCYIEQQFEEFNETYYLRKRYYNPVTGRFSRRDPIKINDGLNLYIFSQDNPILYTDISGESSFYNIYKSGTKELWELVLFESIGACVLLFSSSMWTNLNGKGKTLFCSVNKISPIHIHRQTKTHFVAAPVTTTIMISYSYSFCCPIVFPGYPHAGWRNGFKEIVYKYGYPTEVKTQGESFVK